MKKTIRLFKIIIFLMIMFFMCKTCLNDAKADNTNTVTESIVNESF